jgi:N-acetylneuraminate synthase
MEDLQQRPKVIAEVSGNHNGSIERALEIVKASASAGAHYLKLQTYTADTMTLNVRNTTFSVDENHPLWGGQNLHDLYSVAYTPWEWHAQIFDYAKKLGMTPFSTPFDESALEFLESLSVEMYKVASLEIIDLPLIKQIAQTGKPMIISTGTATLSEVARATEAAREAGCKDLTLLVCTSSYPADPKSANLRRLSILKNAFNVKIGISDHTIGSAVSIAAVALGAELIERHVTLRRVDGGVDSAFSMEPAELQKLISDVDDAYDSLGSTDSWRTAEEAESVRLRPSLYFTNDLVEGDQITVDDVRSVRPSGGLAPEYVDIIIGRTVKVNVKYGDPVTFDNAF